MKDSRLYPVYERGPASPGNRRSRLKLADILYQKEKEFRCIHCAGLVLADPALSGVVNRNHCPYCLWSRHLDQFEAGDRLAACKAPMRPVGLSQKRVRKKYASGAGGELMLVHRCEACGKTALNRIAADDDPEALIVVFEASLQQDFALQVELNREDIHMLGRADAGRVRMQLFGVRAVLE